MTDDAMLDALGAIVRAHAPHRSFRTLTLSAPDGAPMAARFQTFEGHWIRISELQADVSRLAAAGLRHAVGCYRGLAALRAGRLLAQAFPNDNPLADALSGIASFPAPAAVGEADLLAPETGASAHARLRLEADLLAPAAAETGLCPGRLRFPDDPEPPAPPGPQGGVAPKHPAEGTWIHAALPGVRVACRVRRPDAPGGSVLDLASLRYCAA